MQPEMPFFHWFIGGRGNAKFTRKFLQPHVAMPYSFERDFYKLQNWWRQLVFSAWGIQTGPFATTGAPPVNENFTLFHLHIGEPILITPEGQLSEKGILLTPKWDETEGFQWHGHSNWIICSPLTPFCSRIFPTFSPSYWGANSY